MNSSAPATRLPWQAKYLLLALIWGSSFLLMMTGLRAFAPVQISSARILAGAAVLLLLLRISGGQLPRGRRTWLHLFVSGFLLGSLPFFLFAASEERIPSALAGIANAVTPVASVLFGAALLPSDRLPRAKLIAVFAGLAGVVVITQPWQASGRPDLVGFALALGGGASYGLGWTYNRRTLSGVDFGGLSLPTATLLTAAAQSLPLVLVWWWLQRADLARPWSAHPAASPATGTASGSVWLPLIAVLALGVVGTGLAYMLQYDVVRAAGATVSTTVTYLIPVVSVLLGMIVLGERLAWPQFVGAAIILSAAVVIGRSGSGIRRARRSAALS